MTYSPEQVNQLQQDFVRVTAGLQDLNFQGLSEAQQIQSDDVGKYINHGVGRRLSILKKSTERLFEIFPPDRVEVLTIDEVIFVQIFLHAFVINLSGVFDNWAWAFVHRHNLLDKVGGRLNVGIFKERTQQFFSDELRIYLRESNIADWHQQYLKNYRDALAHRIPLYVPPAILTDEDKNAYERLEVEKARLIRAGDWEQLDVVWNEQNRIGAPCFVFMHEFSPDESAQPVYLHPQILSDGITVVDFGNNFYEWWSVIRH